MTTYTQELAFAKDLALQAGEIMVKNFSRSTITVKENMTPVTETDIAISKLVTAEVKKHFPTHAVVDEELQKHDTNTEFQWVCDPVDGTIPFSYSIPTSMFSLALCRSGVPVVGVMYDPYMKRLLYATEDTPTRMNEKEITVNSRALTAGSAIYCVPYWIPQFDSNAFLNYFRKKNIIVSSVESFVYVAMLVANGTITTAVLPAAQAWDRAASILIIRNAGGKITDEHGVDLTVFGDHEVCIMSNGLVHEEMVRITRDCLT